jgi:hypothetical protein
MEWMVLRIVASLLLLIDFALSGGLIALGVSQWALIRGIEINPILRHLSNKSKNLKWDRRARVCWVLYWAFWVALCWLLPAPTIPYYCAVVVVVSLYGIGSMTAF